MANRIIPDSVEDPYFAKWRRSSPHLDAIPRRSSRGPSSPRLSRRNVGPDLSAAVLGVYGEKIRWPAAHDEPCVSTRYGGHGLQLRLPHADGRWSLARRDDE